jgi:Asp-tRNA(Asn)/Glu-tRNA(Gln) amidotransferase A subunit family amidase
MYTRFRLLAAFLVATVGAAPAIHSQSPRSAGSTAPLPATFDVMEKSIPDLQQSLQSGAVTSKQLTAAFLERIRAYDKAGPRLNAMIAVNSHALDAAEALDRERAAGRVRGPLHGIPILIKDNFETADMPTTGGSLALARLETGRDAFQVKKLRDAGAVIVGKTNLHELAAGITTISSMGGQTLNPYDLDRTPGGSSGGTGAGVAANFGVAGMGSDTCGSIRIPSANNNLFGLRGTSGLSSRTGIVPLSHTQDIGGPLARTVTDLALMLDATVGADPADAITERSNGHLPRSYRDGLSAEGLKGVRIGVLKQLFGTAPEDEEVASIVRASLDAMKKAGAELVDVTIPGLEEQMQGSSVINAEFKFDLQDYLAHVPNPPVHSLGEILDSGRYHAALDATFRLRNRPEKRETDEYRRALVKRSAVRQLVLAALDEHQVQALAYPTMRRLPAAIGEVQRGTNCQLSPSTGLPVVAAPAGFSDGGVPVGVELLGAEWTEAALLKMAYAYEQAAHPRRPPFSTPALVNGAAPAPRKLTAKAGNGSVSFVYDVTMSRLQYGVAALPDVVGLALHRGPANENGPVIAVFDPQATSARAIKLSAVDRDALEHGRVYLELVSKNGSASRALLIPNP